MTNPNDFMPSSLDREISTPDQDAFGHRHFAFALQGLIEAESLTPPYSIGLLGGWGTGKSTIKELYNFQLRNDQAKDNGRIRSDLIHTITFNAWRFGGDHIKRALLRHVFLELGGDEEELKDHLFRETQETNHKNRAWWEYTLDVLKVWAFPLPAFLIALLLLVGLLAVVFWLIPLHDELARSLLGVAITGAYAFLLKQIKTPPVSPYNPIKRVELPITSAEQFEDLLVRQLKAFKSGKGNSRNSKYCERLVIFVDDLDRLSAEEMVQGLDAIRTFMEIPAGRLPSGIGLVFVISCDEDKVADAIRGRRQRSVDLPGSVFTQADARRYLDRIFQFRLEIPPFPRTDMRQYAIQKLKEIPGIETDLKRGGVALESLVDRMIHVDVQNPRNALQIVNAFVQSLWLANKRETEELGTGRPGGLHEGAVTQHPIALGALCSLKVNFPDFYRDLQSEPELIQRFTDVVIRHKPLSELPRSTQELLSERYLQKKDESGSKSADVKPAYRSLRLFLSNLVGLRWPDSIQPLLLLSEDPITRKFGAKAHSVYADLVSGDAQGVLEGLGRDADSGTLRLDEARLLYQMTEELRHETATRRVNASRVLADLVDRLPEENVRLLVGPLCRELGDSSELRWQLGTKKIAHVLSVAEPEDRQVVASRLVDEILTTDGELTFRLETMEPPSLDEAIGFARDAVSLALEVRKNHRLDMSSDSKLINWLEDRTVRIAGKEHQLSFQELEDWLKVHEDHVLPALRERYTAMLASHVEQGALDGFDVAGALGRAGKVFSMLLDAGEDSRPMLWSQLTKFVSLQHAGAARVAWETMEGNKASPDTTELSDFLVAFSGRLTEEAEDEEWAIEEVASAAEALLSIFELRSEDISNDGAQALSGLSIAWSEDAETASESCRILLELNRHHEEEYLRVVDEWIPRLLDDLPDECIRILGLHFVTMLPAVQTAVVTQLQPIIATDDISEEVGNRYSTFLESVSDAGWQSDVLVAHLDKLFPQIAARHNNPGHYLERVFPTTAKLLSRATPGVMGSMLHTLFTNAKGQPSVFALLHWLMADRWPELSDDLSPYDPAKIFVDAHGFAVARPASSTAELLKSMSNLLRRGLVQDDQRPLFVEAVCSTWSSDPTKAMSSIRQVVSILGPEQAADLLDGIQWDEEKHQPLLQEAWTLVADHQDTDARAAITNLILAKGPIGPEDEPDEGLRTWVEAQGNNRQQLLAYAMIQEDLEDTHRKRLWIQITCRAEELPPEFFIETLPKVLVLSSIEETAAVVFSDKHIILGLLKSKDERASLSRALMEAFPGASTKTVKAGIAEFTQQLSGQAPLSRLKPEVLTDDDMQILESKFPGAGALRKIERARNKAAPQPQPPE